MSAPKEPTRGTSDGGGSEAEWVRAVQLATFELNSFDRRWAAVTFRSKDRERRILVGALEDARLGLLLAAHAVEAARIEAPPIGAASHGGPVPAGNSRERIVDEAIAQREPDGTWPTQEAVAEALKLTDRRIRQVQGDAGWAGILEDAKVKARDR